MSIKNLLKKTLLYKWYLLKYEKINSKSEVLNLIKTLHPVAIGQEFIRFGNANDGGYLIPNDLQGIEACFSPGVSSVSDFENDCAHAGMKVFLADKSVDAPAFQNEKFHFLKKFIGLSTNSDFISMDDWVSSAPIENNTDLLLQMDIEGAEYMALASLSKPLLNRFRIIVIEFHDLHRFWKKDYYQVASACFGKLLENHTCVHIHPNNCCDTVTYQGVQIPTTMEFTFIRNDRVRSRKAQVHFPHPLDSPNMANLQDVILPEIWYR